jgi:hypothetical protein
VAAIFFVEVEIAVLIRLEEGPAVHGIDAAGKFSDAIYCVHFVSGVEQPFHQMAADKASGPGDQNFTHD